MPVTEQSGQQGLSWLLFAFLTVACWGVYGILLHKGQMLINPASGGPPDPNNRYKAFLLVGVAYFLVAIVGPVVVLVMNQASWKMQTAGMAWSLIAGVAGAVGAFGVLLAFGAAPKPVTAYVPVIMSIIFAGAPMVNALTSITLEKTWAEVRWPFVLGIALAAAGGCLVTFYKPAAHAAAPGGRISAATEIATTRTPPPAPAKAP